MKSPNFFGGIFNCNFLFKNYRGGRCGGQKQKNSQPPLEGVAEDRGAGWRQGKAFPQLSKYGLNHEDAYKKLLNSETYLRVSFLNLIHI